MSLKVHLPMELEQGTEIEDFPPTLWPLEPIDLKRLKFPCFLVWTPLPVVSWLAPYMGALRMALFWISLEIRFCFFFSILLVKEFLLDFSLIFPGNA
jgi:hypothetical protein